MLPGRHLTLGLLFCTVLSCAWAQPSTNTISFLQPGAAPRSAGSELTINPQVPQALAQSTDTVTLAGVPLITGGSGDFDLKPMKIFSDDAQIIMRSADGTTRSLGKPSERPVWAGVDARRPGTSLFVSVNEKSRLFAIAIGDERTSITTIVPDDQAPGSYRIVPNNFPDIPFCHEPRPVPSSALIPATRDVGTRGVAPGQIADIELALDITSDLMAGWGDEVDTMITYVVNLIGPVNMIYRRDMQADFHIVHVMAHETNPFAVDFDRDGDVDSDDQLDAYRAYVRTQTPAAADLYHLLDAQDGLGGIAYLDVLGGGDRSYRTGVSNVQGTLSGVPEDENVYAWDTQVVAHELGHNVGSPHTHCYQPPIDCCQTQCVGCTQVVAQRGTIMSYCHVVPNGAIDMVFHPRVIATVRPKIEASPLVTPHQSAPELIVRGVGEYVVASDSPAKANTLRAQQRNGPAVDQVFTIQNLGNVPVTIQNITASGDPQISVITQPANYVLQQGDRVPVTVRYDPNAARLVTSNITIATDYDDYTFVVAGLIVIPSEPVIRTVSGPIAINEATGYWTRIPVYVENVPGWVSDVQVRFNGTDCDVPDQAGVRHPRVGELYMALESPEGTQVYLMRNPGGSDFGGTGANLCNTLFTDSATREFRTVSRADAPFSGEFRPLQPFSQFDGERPNGVWTLMVYDTAARNTGYVNSASIIIRGEVEAGVQDWTAY